MLGADTAVAVLYAVPTLSNLLLVLFPAKPAEPPDVRTPAAMLGGPADRGGCERPGGYSRAGALLNDESYDKVGGHLLESPCIEAPRREPPRNSIVPEIAKLEQVNHARSSQHDRTPRSRTWSLST